MNAREHPLRVAVVGAGGAGGYFAACWALAGLEVTVVARGAHLDAIRARGLRVESPHGAFVTRPRAVSTLAEIGATDLIMLATKTWQLQTLLDQLPTIDPAVPIFGVQNGVESVDRLGTVRDAHTVLGATCRIIAFKQEPGSIRHVGADPSLRFGEPDGGLSQRVVSLQRALDASPRLEVLAAPDIRREIWRKFLFFAPLSGVGSLTRAPIGVVREHGPTRDLLERAMLEVQDLADACGIDLGRAAIAETLAFVDSLPAAGTSSLQRDVEAGRRTELDALSGAVTRLGHEHGVPTPVHELITRALEPLELRARGELAWPLVEDRIEADEEDDR
ncbi:MAG: 2-dehydropantoate 2-reductase [Acidobacteriota bacterium]